MSDIAWRDFGKIENCQRLQKYLDGREYGHNDYCHYSTLKVLNNILASREIWLSPVSGFNDAEDSRVFKEREKEHYYSFCIATGKNENLPLWYMYAAMDKCNKCDKCDMSGECNKADKDNKGGRIRLAKGRIKRLSKECKLALCEKIRDEKGKNIKLRKIADLKKDENVELRFQDVLYYKEEAGKISLKYNTMTNYIVSPAEFEKYKEQNLGFYKDLIWFYEKETRLLAKIDDDLIKGYDADKLVVTLNIASIVNKIKIELAPDIDNVEDILQNEEYPAIKEFFISNSSLQLSEHHGKVRFR